MNNIHIIQILIQIIIQKHYLFTHLQTFEAKKISTKQYQVPAGARNLVC